MYVRRNQAVFDLTPYPITKTDVFLLTLLEEPLTLSQLLDIAPGERTRLEARARALIALGLIEECDPKGLRQEPDDDSLEERITVRPAAPPRSLLDEAVTLRPPPLMPNPFGDEVAATPMTGVRARPRRSAPSPFSAPRVRKTSG